MNAKISAESILNKCIVNRRSYAKQNSNDEVNLSRIANSETTEAEKPLVGKLLDYVKSLGGGLKHREGGTDNNNREILSIDTHGCPKIQRVPMMGNDSIDSVTRPTYNGIKVHHTTFKLDTPERLFKTEAQTTSNAEAMAATSTKQQVGRTFAMEQLQSQPIVTNKRDISKTLLTYPVVPLQETLHHYLRSVQPLVGEAGMSKEIKIATDFLHDKGQVLQNLLEKAAKSKENWLTDLWTNEFYLRYRAPLTIFSSPCISFPRQKFRNTLDYLDFTAKVIYAMCDFNRKVENNNLGVNKLDDFDLDNSQFHNVFGTVRIPKQSCDILQQCLSNYVIVIHKNNFYKVTVQSAEDNRIFNVLQIQRQLLRIIKSGQDFGPAVGLLTHDKRDNWAESYGLICRKEENAINIKCIEQSLFTVSLDEYLDVPPGEERSLMAAQILHGGGSLMNSANRWMDKTLQLIINPNGMVGLCCEHSPAEPQPAASIMDYVLKNIKDPNYGREENASYAKPELKRIDFSDIDECVDWWLMSADRTINEITQGLQLHVVEFDCYGRKVIAERSLEPDSFVQMALQLAFYNLHHELPAQQELAHLRIFKYGRSESIRCTTNESLKFVTAMTAKNQTNSNRFLALQAAVNVHRHLAMLALRGRGIDRHFFGLEQMAQQHSIPLPKFFRSEGYLKSKYSQILSSQLMTAHDSFMVYGPLNADGYACCYNLREKDIIFAISAWNHNPKISASSYGTAIETALADMGHLIVDVKRPSRSVKSRNR